MGSKYTARPSAAKCDKIWQHTHSLEILGPHKCCTFNLTCNKEYPVGCCGSVTLTSREMDDSQENLAIRTRDKDDSHQSITMVPILVDILYCWFWTAIWSKSHRIHKSNSYSPLGSFPWIKAAKETQPDWYFFSLPENLPRLQCNYSAVQEKEGDMHIIEMSLIHIAPKV